MRVLHQRFFRTGQCLLPRKCSLMQTSGRMCKSRPTPTTRLDETRPNNKTSDAFRSHQIRKKHRNAPFHRPPNPRLPTVRERLPRSQKPVYFRKQRRISCTVCFLRRSSSPESSRLELWPPTCYSGRYQDSLQEQSHDLFSV